MKSIIEIFQKDYGTYPFRTIIDNLTDDQIIECIEEYTNQFREECENPNANAEEEIEVMTSNQRHQLVLFDKIENELSRRPFSNEELEFILKAVKNSQAFVIVFDKA